MTTPRDMRLLAEWFAAWDTDYLTGEDRGEALEKMLGGYTGPRFCNASALVSSYRHATHNIDYTFDTSTNLCLLIAASLEEDSQ